MATVDQIRHHIDAAAGDDPRQALIAVRKLISEDISHVGASGGLHSSTRALVVGTKLAPSRAVASVNA
jgi:hypothetical protein